MEYTVLIEEAVDNGACLRSACESLGITDRTYYRWKKLNKDFGSCEDRRQYADHASELIQKTYLTQHRLTTAPLVLHSDNGSPMKGCYDAGNPVCAGDHAIEQQATGQQ